MSALLPSGLVSAHAGPGDEVPALTPLRLLTGWSFEPVAYLVAVLAAGLYLYGVQRLRARGDRWSPWRSFWFLGAGLGSFLLATQSVLATYDAVLLSVHMVQHMVLMMLTPVFLALGAPVTLALRTVPRRPRRWLLAAIHSRPAAVLSFPPVAGALFVASPFVLYFSPLYEATLRNGLLHDASHVWFVVVGSLWFWPLFAVDPVPRRWPYPIRLIAVFATMPFHAWMGVAIMSMSTLLAGDWYRELGRDWGASPASDQRTAGGILWASGDIVALVVFGVLFALWVHDAEREAAREDRRLDRLEAAARHTSTQPPPSVQPPASRGAQPPASSGAQPPASRDAQPPVSRRAQPPPSVQPPASRGAQPPPSRRS